jgi:hypothetical protein
VLLRIQGRPASLQNPGRFTRSDVSLRDYSGEEIAEFLQADQLDATARAIAERFTGPASTKANPGRAVKP